MQQLIVYVSAPYKRKKPAPWPSTNDYIHALNVNRYAGGALKRKFTELVATSARVAMQEQNWQTPSLPVKVHFIWHELNHRRDLDNIRGGAKFVLDGLVMAGAIKDDSQKYISHLSDDVTVDKTGAGVVAVIETIGAENA